MMIIWWLFPWKGVESSQWCGKSRRNEKYSGDLGKSQYEEHPGVSRWKLLFKVTAMTDVTFKAPVPDHSDCRLKWRIWWPPGQYLGFLIIAIYNIPTNIPSYIFTSPTFLQMLFFSEPLICSSTGTRPTRRSRSSILLKLVQLPPPANNGWHFLIMIATAITTNNPGEGGRNNTSSSEAEVSSVNNDAGQHQHDHNLHNYNNDGGDKDHHQVLLCRKSMTKRSTSSSLSLRWSDHD